MTDAEMIERATESVARLLNYGKCRPSDVDNAACLLEQLANRLAELTKPTPWRAVEGIKQAERPESGE